MKIALIAEEEDRPYLGYLKPLLAGHEVIAGFRSPNTCHEVALRFDACITTREDFLRRHITFNHKANIDNYAGSLIYRHDKPFLVLDPLSQLASTPTGEFITKRYLRKLTHRDEWFKSSEFTWQLCDELSVAGCYEKFQTADIIAIDIETSRGQPSTILCVSYCAVWYDSSGGFTTHSIVLPFSNLDWVKWVRKFNQLPQPKVFQNGLFDNLHFLRFGCPVTNYLLDTLDLFHSWYSELPKTLGYITLFLLRDAYYWKDEAKTGDPHQFYQYNAKDSWATANSVLALLSECGPWTLENYKEKFPIVPLCLAANFEGLRYDLKLVDKEDPNSLYNIQLAIVQENLRSLQAKVGNPNFNPGSWQQIRRLFEILVGKKNADRIEKTDEKARNKIGKMHPLNQMLMDEVNKYKEAQKLVGTYLGAHLWANDRLLYSLRPSATDTNRLACSQSSFEYSFIGGKSEKFGAQIQNQPEYNKQVIISDEGFLLGEADNEQSEAYCLGYISGDEGLIGTLTSGNDFHSVNIERFFGVSYDEVWDQIKGKTKNKPLRDLSKRVNHGTAYVMGAMVLLETMGLENVVKAQILLGLPSSMRPVEVCEYLLSRYHTAYPGVKTDFYEWVKSYVKQNSKLVSALGWTRFCFGDPGKNSRHFKALVAHVPQNLSVSIINRGMLRVFREIQLANWRDFRIKAQIHDSVLFQYRIGREDLAWKARDILEQDIKVTDVKGVTRVMRIPVALKGGATHWSELEKLKRAA